MNEQSKTYFTDKDESGFWKDPGYFNSNYFIPDRDHIAKLLNATVFEPFLGPRWPLLTSLKTGQPMTTNQLLWLVNNKWVQRFIELTNVRNKT